MQYLSKQLENLTGGRAPILQKVTRINCINLVESINAIDSKQFQARSPILLDGNVLPLGQDIFGTSCIVVGQSLINL